MRNWIGIFLPSFCLAFVSIATAAPAELTRPLPDRFPNLYAWRDTCNVYVWKHQDEALLVNIGAGSVVDQLPKIGVKKVTCLLVNNHHRENLQGIGRLDLETVQVVASQIEAEILASPTTFRKWHPKLGDKYSVYGASYVRPPNTPVEFDQVQTADSQITWYDLTFDCLATPGHSPGEMTYVIRQHDQAVAFSGGLMHDGARLTNWFDSEWDYGFAAGIDALLTSVEQLTNRKIDVILPVQGPPIHNATQQLEAYRQRLQQFRAAYVRGYPVFDKDPAKRDRISVPTKVPHLNQITPHLYKLSHDFQGRNFAMLISDKGHGLILDCGLIPAQVLDEIIVGARQHLGLTKIDAFWISHMHGDHFLLGPMLKEKYGAEAWTLDKIVDRCENPGRYDYAALVNTYGDGFDGMKIDKGFRAGERIDWQGYQIQVDWLPGQTEFGCCLWLDIDGKRIAFTGDNLFGDPTDENQTAHDCVVCRNSAILEEGHILGSQYLLDLKPDIVMAAHSYVMPEPEGILRRYHAWSKQMAQLYRDMLPETNYEYLFDPYWVSAYPYRVDLSDGQPKKVEVTVRNFRDSPQQHRIELVLPPGITARPVVLEGTVPPRSRQKFSIELQASDELSRPGIQIIPFDIELDGKHYGQWFDIIARTEKSSPAQ
ncbi:MBL fold metallo-hydrolase [Bremerella sp. JC817]|uniref:MBL fold metallo-hydrolase n=1 Tax=Bremerella sp. JC817 TaxID=3231756 RepID=UPI003458B5D0